MAGQMAPRLAKRIVVVRDGLPVDALAAREDLGELGIVAHAGGLTAAGGKLRGGAVSAHNDHRVAMSLAVAASACVGETTIDDAECVKKSAPDFWKEYRAMGGSFMIDKEGRQ